MDLTNNLEIEDWKPILPIIEISNYLITYIFSQKQETAGAFFQNKNKFHTRSRFQRRKYIYVKDEVKYRIKNRLK